MTGGDAPVPDGGPSPFLRRAARPWLHQVVPVAEHLPKYRRPALARDLAAGLTVGALAIPSAMAYAELVGVPAVNGLYVLLLPVVAYAAFSSSRQVSLGPEAGVAAMLGAGLVPFTAGDPARALPLVGVVALLVGACYAVARLFRLGWIADYFSVAVLIGYLHGIAVVLIVGQLGKLTGVTTGETETLPQLAHHLTHLGDIHTLSAVLGGAALVIVLGLRRLSPRVPGSLIVLVGGIVISAAVDLASRGVAVVGPIPSGLPRFGLPDATGSDVVRMLPIALGVFFVSFADSILTARAYAGKHNQSVDANQELLALGLANVAAGLTQGFTPSASGSRTAVNDQMGARTQLAGLFAVALAVAVLLFLTAPIEYLPSPVLAALIVAAAISLITPARWKSLATAGRVPVVIAAFTTAAVILVGVLPALVAAVALSIIEVVARGARPNDAVLGFVPRLDRYGDVRFHRSAQVDAGVVVYRLDDRLFFANTEYVVGRINEAIAGAATDTRSLVFDAERVPGIDVTAIEMLDRLIRDLRARGIEFIVARASRDVVAALERSAVLDAGDEGRVFPTVHAAVASCRDRATSPESGDDPVGA